MEALVGFLALLATAWMIYGLFKPDKALFFWEGKESRRWVVAIWLGAVVVIGGLLPEDEPAQDIEQVAAAEDTEEEEPPTLEERVVEIARSEISYEEELNVSLTETEEGHERAFVLYQTGSSFSASTARISLLQDAMDFIRETSALDEIDEYRIVAEHSLVDEYGNTSVEPVAWFELDRATAQKINWENLSRDMFENLLRKEGTLRFHQAIQD